MPKECVSSHARQSKGCHEGVFSRDEGEERGLLESLKINRCHIGSAKTFSPFKLPNIKVCRPGREVEVIFLHLRPVMTELEQCTFD